jgi:hypothetical protein
MKKNMGRWDRTLRLVAALVIAGLLIAGVLKGTAAIVLAVVALIFALGHRHEKEGRHAPDRRLTGLLRGRWPGISKKGVEDGLPCEDAG